MSVVNLKKVHLSTKPYIWIPPSSTANWKITVEDSDGTELDITNQVTMLEVEDYVTESVGRFEFEIPNPDDSYTTKWSGNEIFRLYKDYAATPTSLRFRGRLEKPSKRGFKLNVKGKSESAKLLDITVTKSYAGVECSVILKALFDAYATEFTYVNINASNVTLTVDWYQKPFWDCVKELCQAAGFECYVDADLDCHFFESGSVTNTAEGIVHEYNLLEVEDFTPDLTQVKNRIIVYGALQQGIQIIYTDEDITSQASYGIKEEIIYDDNVTNYTQAQDLANYILASKKDPPEVGSIKGFILASTQPGDKIWCSSPNDNIPPNPYITQGYKDKINLDTGEFSTTVYLNKEPRKVSHVIKSRIEEANRTKQTSINPYEMRYSYTELFDIDTGTHTNTEVSDGVLKLQSGQSSGTWLSNSRTLPSNLSKAYLILVGETLDGSIVSVSGDNGVNYQVISNKGLIDITSAIGSVLRVKVVFSNADTQIESLSIMYTIN